MFDDLACLVAKLKENPEVIGIARDNTVFESTISGGSVLNGVMEIRTTLR